MISGIPVGEDLDKLKKLITGDTTGIRRLQADLRLITHRFITTPIQNQI